MAACATNDWDSLGPLLAPTTGLELAMSLVGDGGIFPLVISFPSGAFVDFGGGRGNLTETSLQARPQWPRGFASLWVSLIVVVSLRSPLRERAGCVENAAFDGKLAARWKGAAIEAEECMYWFAGRLC